MANVATLTAKLTADTSGLKRGLGQAERDVKGFGGRTSSALKKLGPMVAVAAAAGAAAVGVMAVKSVAAFADFEKADREALSNKSGGVLERLAQEVIRISGVSVDEAEVEVEADPT